MTSPATSLHNETATEPTAIAPLRMRPAVSLEPAMISTKDGRYVTGGVLEMRRNGAGWSGTLRQLDRPGVVAALYFGEGVREVIVRMADGERSLARIAGTSFIAGAQRICELTGIEG